MEREEREIAEQVTMRHRLPPGRGPLLQRMRFLFEGVKEEQGRQGRALEDITLCRGREGLEIEFLFKKLPK